MGRPAIDAILTANCPTLDQRGLTRPDPDSPAETACDSGAFKSGEGLDNDRDGDFNEYCDRHVDSNSDRNACAERD